MAALYSVFVLVVTMAYGPPHLAHGQNTWWTPFPSAGFSGAGWTWAAISILEVLSILNFFLFIFEPSLSMIVEKHYGV